MIEEQIDDISVGIQEMKASRGERMTVKRLEQTKASLQARLERLIKDDRKDSVVTFEQLGVDKLFIDEAHNYKNGFIYTKMRNVAGLSTNEAQKSADLFLKCRYLDERYNGKAIVFATGTPVSNSMTEIYTMMRYLQYDTLIQKGFKFFDSWASQFGEVTTAIELAPEGTKRQRSTQIVFCDMSTPKYDGSFNVYEDIKQKLIEKGVPEKEIAFIYDAKTDLQKKALFAKVRKGQVRVIIGSTPMMGSGANIQDKLIALHDLDAPWRPSDLAQRAGRIVRQGNENAEVNIYRYVTERTFDSYLYQTLETK